MNWVVEEKMYEKWSVLRTLATKKEAIACLNFANASGIFLELRVRQVKK